MPGFQASYFGDYGGGIFEDNRCCEAVSDPDCIWTLNHEVTVVGYGNQAEFSTSRSRSDPGNCWRQLSYAIKNHLVASKAPY